MKNLSADERHQLAGEYSAPAGLYEYTKTLPFTGRVKSTVTSLVAGEWTEITLVYEVGASGLADGAWIKGTFKFYSVSCRYRTPYRRRDVSMEEACSDSKMIRTGHFSRHLMRQEITMSVPSTSPTVSFQIRLPRQSSH